MRSFLAVFLSISFLFFALPVSEPLASLSSWKISCGVDKGSIKKKGRSWVFKTSSNKCKGGVFKQRAEIKSGNIGTNRKGTYRFSTGVTMKSSSPQRYDVFQIHDGRNSCAPPLKLTVSPSGRLTLDSEYKFKGAGCQRNTSLAGATTSAGLNFTGVEKQLMIDISFDGNGGFGVIVYVDGSKQIQGKYSPPSGGDYFVSRHYYFKHGVYSRNRFDYTLESKNMSVKKVR